MPYRRAARLLSLVVALGVLLGAMTASAPAKGMSQKAKVKARSELRKAVRRNPKVITRRSFLKKASLVNFKLPITVRLRNATSATNPNAASVDLGASLGQRAIGLGGSLAGEIGFKDSFDGGALGNVDLTLNPGPKALSSTSIPLLWNTDVTGAGTTWETTFTGTGTAGCANFTGQTPAAYQVPYFTNPGDVTPAGTIPTTPGVDDPNNLQASAAVGSPDNLGPSFNPFPQAASAPGGFAQPPSVKDTIFRTGPLSLQIAPPGTEVDQSNGTGVNGSQNIVVGKSGGQANLFGNIPGKSTAIDVTVSLRTRINSILRSMDPDPQQLVAGQPWPSAFSVCRQAWTGGVDNFITGVRLTGGLKISPAITPDGKLRIAKATLSSPDQARIALAACLYPDALYAAQNASSDTAPTSVNGTTLPIQETVARGAPTGKDCGDPPTRLVQDAPTLPLNPAGAGYTVTNDGSKVSVAGDLSVTNVSADVLIGDV